MINLLNKIKPFFCSVALFFLNSNIYCQETPLGSKIVGNGDSANYYIGHFPVAGSDGLDLHWHGGIRFGDFTSNSVMQISSGKVGIGIAVPLFKLDVNGVVNINSETTGGGLRFNSAANNHQDSRNWYISSDGYAYGDFVIKSSLTFNGAPNDAKLIIKSNGNVGIGTINPLNKFSVNDDSNQFIANYTGGKVVQSYKYTAITYGESMSWGNSSNIGYMSHQTDKSLSGLYFTNYGDSEILSSLFIKRGGNVGIGITNPQNKLDVNGTIHSKEVKVDMNGWSDFVFKREYDLPTLEEVEKHINDIGHLKDIPSEEEVLKDGINLGEMNSKLLQKIEELTLYSIEQNKEIKNLKKENEVLKELMERISKLEKSLEKR